MTESSKVTVARRPSRAKEFERRYIAEYHPEMGARRRYEWEVGSRFAVDALRVLETTRKGMPKKVESYPHAPCEAPLRQLQYHVVCRFSDDSHVAIYDNRMIVADRSEDIIKITPPKKTAVFAGAWDGRRIEDLLLSIKATAFRFGIAAEKEGLTQELTRALTIPHQSPKHLKAHAYNRLGEVVAIDSRGTALLRTGHGLETVPGTPEGLRQAELSNQRQSSAMAEVAPGTPELAVFAGRRALLSAAREIMVSEGVGRVSVPEQAQLQDDGLTPR